MATTLDPWRLIVRLKSKRALVEYAQFHGLSGRALARKADEIAKKKDPGASVKPAIVGHLMRTGKSSRDTCSLVTARALEEALGCPPGFLFEPSLSPVADATSRRDNAA